MKTLKLYDNTVDLQFSEGNHRYKVNGEYVEGVTTTLSKVVNKEGLVPWAAKMVGTYIEDNATSVDGFYQVDKEILDNAKKFHIKKKDEGADVGSIVHNWIENYVNKQIEWKNDPLSRALPDNLPDVLPVARPSIEAFLSWEKTVNPKYLYSERIMFSKQYGFAGTTDVLVEVNGKVGLLDWKTSDPNREWKNGKYTGLIKPRVEHFFQDGGYAHAMLEEDGIKPDFLGVIYITKEGKLYPFYTDNVDYYMYGYIKALEWARSLKGADKEAWSTEL